MTETLKPCPFCGDKAVLKEDLRWHGAFRVECSSCDATVWATGENNPASAIAHWNRRAAPPAGVVVWVANDDRDTVMSQHKISHDSDDYGDWMWAGDAHHGPAWLAESLGLAPGECARVRITREET